MDKEFDIVIGLEVHVQLATQSKIFCACSTEFDSPPNTNICPVCCGYPGVLPVLNQKVLKLAVRVGLALNCTINKNIYFERKNYFYPDLPKGYQISQFKLPLGENGFVELPSEKKIGIKRVHMEEDAGKLIHKDEYSLIDYNRTGIPLLEIVTYPDIESPQEAFRYLTQLKRIIQYIGASSCDMEKGYLRCDANISLKLKGGQGMGTKVELKNMNSFKGVKEALDYEAKRQKEALARGGTILQETRLWDDTNKTTRLMRTKEEAHDYRYFPEPDLVDFIVSEELIEKEKAQVGEFPLEKKARFLETYPLSEKEVNVLISAKWLADFFEQSCTAFNEPKQIANWLIGPFLELVNNLKNGFEETKISPEKFSTIVRYFTEERLNNLGAKRVLAQVITTNREVDAVIEEESLIQVSGKEELSRFVKEVIAENPKPAGDYCAGKKTAVMFLVGCVMKKTKGKANPKVVAEVLKEKLKEKKGDS